MDAGFKDWIIKQHEKMNPWDKQVFLKLLKFKPDKILRIIAYCFDDWRAGFTAETGIMAFNYDSRDFQEILQAFQEHFAKELEAITQ